MEVSDLPGAARHESGGNARSRRNSTWHVVSCSQQSFDLQREPPVGGGAAAGVEVEEEQGEYRPSMALIRVNRDGCEAQSKSGRRTGKFKLDGCGHEFVFADDLMKMQAW